MASRIDQDKRSARGWRGIPEQKTGREHCAPEAGCRKIFRISVPLAGALRQGSTNTTVPGSADNQNRLVVEVRHCFLKSSLFFQNCNGSGKACQPGQVDRKMGGDIKGSNCAAARSFRVTRRYGYYGKPIGSDRVGSAETQQRPEASCTQKICHQFPSALLPLTWAVSPSRSMPSTA